MRVPYIVGRWVRDRNHYGRQRLFHYLLHAHDTAIWVVGARRIGKTSLLRQLEFLTDCPGSELTPLFWDMQGCETSGDLSFELFMALDDVRERFTRLGIDVTRFDGQDALLILRRLSRELAALGKTLLLLIDEAEVLITLARHEAAWLARLRKVFQDGSHKTVITSTKVLAQLNQLTADWDTSPFLFGFSMLNLWSLDADAAIALIEQQQTERAVTVDAQVLEEILLHTNRHPYLIQFLCQRLYSENARGEPSLRLPGDEDLEPDHLLAGFFLIDFQHMTRLERQLLLTVAAQTIITEQDILARLPAENPARIRTFLWGLDKLGHVRQVYGQWTIGNEFLRRWLQQEGERLWTLDEPPLDDSSMERLLQVGHAQETRAFAAEVEQLEIDYRALRAREKAANGRLTADDRGELDRVSRHLAAARRDMSRTFVSGGWSRT